MALNKITSFFSKSKKKLIKTDNEDEEIKPPVRRYSLSKSGRMKAKEYSRACLSEINLSQQSESSGSKQKRSRSQESNRIHHETGSPEHRRNRSDEFDRTEDEENIEDIVNEMNELSKGG